MKLEKAIELLQTDLLIPGSVDKLDFQDAEQLGIEALKRVQLQHDPGGVITPDLLPGEDE